MTQRNVELQLQAIDMIERKHRLVKKHDETAATSSNEQTAQKNDKVEKEGAKLVEEDITTEELE